MKVIGIAAATLLMSSGVADAGEWAVVKVGPEGIAAVDISTIQTTGSIRTYWVITGFAERSERGPLGFDYFLDNVRINCDRRTSQVTFTSIYTFAETVGSFVDSYPSTDPARPIVPDSVASSIADQVCGVRPFHDTRFATPVAVMVAYRSVYGASDRP